MSATGALNSRPLYTVDLFRPLSFVGAGTLTVIDLSDRLRGGKWRRGRSDILADFEPGEGSLVLANRDRALDPTNPSGPYYGTLDVGMIMRVHAMWPFVGYNANWDLSADSQPWTVVGGAPTLTGVASTPWPATGDEASWIEGAAGSGPNARGGRWRYLNRVKASIRATSVALTAAGTATVAYKPSACLIPVRPSETLCVALAWGSTTRPATQQLWGVQFQYLNAALAPVGAPVTASALRQHLADTTYIDGTPRWGGDVSVATGSPQNAQGLISASLAVPASPPAGAVWIQPQVFVNGTAAGQTILLGAMHADYGAGPVVDEDQAGGLVDEWPQEIDGVSDETATVPFYDWLGYLGEIDVKTPEFVRVIDPGPAAYPSRPVVFYRFADLGSGTQIGVTRSMDSAPAMWGVYANAHGLMAQGAAGSQGPSGGTAQVYDPEGGVVLDGTSWLERAPDAKWYTFQTQGTQAHGGQGKRWSAPSDSPWPGIGTLFACAFSLVLAFQTSGPTAGADNWTLYSDDTVRITVRPGNFRIYVNDMDPSTGYWTYDYPTPLDDTKMHLVVIDLAAQSQTYQDGTGGGTAPPVYVDGSTTPLTPSAPVHVATDVSGTSGVNPIIGQSNVAAQHNTPSTGFHGTIAYFAAFLHNNVGPSGGGFPFRPGVPAMWSALTTPRDAETVSSRLANLLAYCGITAPQELALDSGGEPLQPVKWSGTALELARKFAAADAGLFYVDRRHRFRYVSRQNRLRAPLNASVATAGDRPVLTSGGELPVLDWVPTYARQDVVNEAAVTRQGSASPQVAVDTDSQAKYGRRAVTAQDVLVRLDTRASDYAQYVVGRLSKPRTRVKSLRIRLEQDNRWVPVLARLEPEQRLTLKRRSSNPAVPLSTYYVTVQSLSVTLGQDRSVLYEIVVADTDSNASYLVLDDPTLGRLDANRLAY